MLPKATRQCKRISQSECISQNVFRVPEDSAKKKTQEKEFFHVEDTFKGLPY